MTKFEIVCHESLSGNSKSPSQGQDEDNNKKYQEKDEEEEDQEQHHKGRIVLLLSKQPDSSEASTSSSSSSSRKKHQNKVEEEEEEDNDGFKTPTSLDHRIPVSKQCPPAPRKLPSKQSLKRKASSSSSSPSHSSLFSCRSHPLDLSKEVELLFPATQHNHQHLCSSHQSTKKVRRERSPCDV